MGRAITSAVAMMFNMQKGIAALYTSAIVVSRGATAFITNRLRPNGGDIPAMFMLTRNMRRTTLGQNPEK